jgi:hypothetical protein
MVKFKWVISKKMLVRLLFFAALTGIAIAFDFYFEVPPDALEKLNAADEEEASCDHGSICLFSQVSGFSAKSPVQKVSGRKFQDQAHVRLLQRCHQMRNHLALKAETETLRKPLFLSYHHLIFRHYYFSYPDDEVAFS